MGMLVGEGMVYGVGRGRGWRRRIVDGEKGKRRMLEDKRFRSEWGGLEKMPSRSKMGHSNSTQ